MSRLARPKSHRVCTKSGLCIIAHPNVLSKQGKNAARTHATRNRASAPLLCPCSHVPTGLRSTAPAPFILSIQHFAFSSRSCLPNIPLSPKDAPRRRLLARQIGGSHQHHNPESCPIKPVCPTVKTVRRIFYQRSVRPRCRIRRMRNNH